MKKIILPAVSVTLLIGVVIFYFLGNKHPESIPPISTVETPSVQVPDEPAILYPIAEPPAPVETPPLLVQPEPPSAPLAPSELPGIDSVDDVLRKLLTLLNGNKQLIELLQLDHFVQRVVVSIDNLTRNDLSRRQMPIKNATGLFLVQGELGNEVISPHNARRYALYMALAEKLDSKQLVSIYIRFYPLFQKAYTNLGYPSAYFNDRLIEVIDHLLETPERLQPIRLERPAVLYRFADPDLESRSTGQKILLRIGPENAQRIKEKLKELRDELTTRSQNRQQ